MERPRSSAVQERVTSRDFRSTAAWVAVLVVVAWLVHPVLTPVHVEGFSASIESLAIHFAQGSIDRYDALHPANLEFFALSRLGTITFVAALIRWTGLNSEWAMRATMWIGFVGLTWASIVLVRHWTAAPMKLVIVALLLIPGVSESAFFYNDNVFSAALALGALAVVVSSDSIGATAVAGLLFGAGVVARLDAVLLAPAVALIGYDRHRFGRAFVHRGVVFAATALLAVVLVPGAVHATILDVVRISTYAVSLWDRPPTLAPHAREFAYFIGTPAALLVAFGLLGLVKARVGVRVALLAGVPLLFNLVALGKIWQSRQLLSMTPFFAALAIVGWQYLSDHQDGSRRRLRLAVVAIGALTLFGPFGRLQVSDGPRAPYGRFWSPLLWTRWQGAIASNMTEMQRFVANLDEPFPMPVVTDTWDADRYLHLHLQRAGFRAEETAPEHRVCQAVGEVFVKDHVQVIHLRLHQPFLATWRWFAAQRLERLALPCLAELRAPALYLVAPGLRTLTLFEPSPSLRGRLDIDLLAAAYRNTGYDPMVMMSLAPSDLAPLRATYAADAAQLSGLITDPETQLERASRRMEHQVWRAASRR